MPLPTLSPVQIGWVNSQVAAYIEDRRQTYARRAGYLAQAEKENMRPFFRSSILDSTRVLVLLGERVSNPPFYCELIRMGFSATDLPDFAHMAAITFVDTVVSHGPFTDRTLFHELVHVVQYEKLGLGRFAEKYVSGFLTGGSYEAIPLEANAYALDARYGGEPGKPFSVADEVQSWMDANRF